MEIFEKRQQDGGKDIPEEYAEKGMLAWKKLVKELENSSV
jgi:hypothetical protein